MSKLYKIEDFYIKTKFKYHKNLKQKFLDLIDQMPNISHDNIKKTDWKILEPKTYEKLFHYYFEDILDNIGKLIKASDCKITSLWFQQYYKNNSHSWHNHPGSDFSNIYYLELPNTKYKTQFYNLLTKKPFKDIKIEEGDIITFKGSMPHRSKKIISTERKTVIVFNTNYKTIKI